MDGKPIDDIKEQIKIASFGKNGQCFLLIDASLKQYQSDTALYDTLKGYHYYPVTFQRDELYGALPLFLFPLNMINNSDCELFNNSILHSLNELKSEKIEAGEGRSVCAWISTELTGEQLAEQLALSAVQSVQSGSDILLRYFDPSVFGLLALVLDHWQQKHLLSNISTWAYIDGDGVAQVVNGDGECKKKLNYSLGLTTLNVSEMGRVVVVNRILTAYRKMSVINKLREQDAVRLLRPALNYFYSTFYPSDNDVIEFGLDILISQRLFYQDRVFDKYLFDNRKENLCTYSDIKFRTGIQVC